MEVTPLVGRDPVRLLRPAPGEAAEAVLLRGEGRQLVCQGGETAGRPWAVRCEEHLPAAGEEGRPVPLVWRDGVVVAGRLWVGREPAAGSRVTVLPADLRTVRFEAVPLHWDEETRELERSVEADAAGRFRLPPLVPGEYLLALRLPGGRLVNAEPVRVPEPAELRSGGGGDGRSDGEAPPAAEAPPAPSPPVLDLGDLVFEPGVEVPVLVLDREGLPVAGALVGAAQGASPEETVFYETRSDADGRARLAGLDPLLPVRLSCGGPGLRWDRQGYPSPPAGHLCRLERLARLAGRVLDAAGEPVVATVTLDGTVAPGPDSAPADGSPLEAGGAGAGAGERTIRRGPGPTAAAGDFAFDDLPAGRYRVRVAAGGYASAAVEADLEPGEERRLEPVVLAPGRRWEGRVVDGVSGEPVAGARVSAVDPAGAFRAVAGEDGTFAAVTGTEGPLEVAVEGELHPRTRLTVGVEARRSDEPVVLPVFPGGFLEIRYWGPDGEPCAGCPVGVTGPGGAREVVTDAAGLARTGPLAPGRYQVSPVELRSYGGFVTRSSGEVNRFPEVRPGEVVRVALGEAGRAVEVEVWPVPPPGWRLTVTGTGVSERVALDEGGRGRVRWLEGPVSLFLFGPGGASMLLGELPEPPRDRRLEVALPSGGVSGRLLREPGASPAGPVLELVDAGTGTVRGRTVPDADGRFHLPFVPPGHYAVAAAGRVLRHVAVGERTEEVGELEVPAGAAEPPAPRP